MKTFTVEKVKFQNKSRGEWFEYVIFLFDDQTGKQRAICALNAQELDDLRFAITNLDDA